MRNLIKDECAVDPEEKRYIFIGCEDVPGFEAVALGEKVDVKKVTPGIVAKAKQALDEHPRIRAFLFECTELPPYSDAVRAATGLPVYDSITACDYFISGYRDNARFGINNWRKKWDGVQEAYTFGSNLGDDDLKQLVNAPGKKPLRPPGQGSDVKVPPTSAPTNAPTGTEMRVVAPGQRKRGAVSLGVIRLDYDYPPAPGDIDCPDSFGYDVFYRVVPGLTFAMCQSGKLTREVEEEFKEAIDWFEMKGVSGITGDCGFMMYLQKLARQNTKKPVFMSSLAQLPAVTCAYNVDELIAVLTANGKTLHPMRDLIKDECGVDPDEKRYIFVGCEDVPGFEAVALGEKVDVQKVTPGIVAKAKNVLKQHPRIRAFLFECTELPPYSDAVRAATGLPVYDSITACDYFISGYLDNARFGINNWQEQWDGVQADYAFGANLGAEDREKLVNAPGKMPLRPPGQGH
jgi:hypothetical protein